MQSGKRAATRAMEGFVFQKMKEGRGVYLRAGWDGMDSFQTGMVPARACWARPHHTKHDKKKEPYDQKNYCVLLIFNLILFFFVLFNSSKYFTQGHVANWHVKYHFWQNTDWIKCYNNSPAPIFFLEPLYIPVLFNANILATLNCKSKMQMCQKL